jgi:hypothetical protein
MPRSNASFLGQLLGTSQKITASALDSSVSASLGGGSVTTYATAAALPLSGNTTGDQAFVSETSRLYIWTGAGWYNIALINTNPTITSGAAASYRLSIDGTPTVLTLVANDPEGLPITWSYSITTGSLTNGGGNTATVTQADNVFTITPSTTEAYEGVFEITFTASDGVNLATSASTFTLSWYIDATGGTITTYSSGGINYKVHTFTSSGTFTVTAEGEGDILMVAGGGSGGADTNVSGGGGAGGVLIGTAFTIAPGTYNIVIGNGGSVGSNGGDTTAFGAIAIGGGSGARGDIPGAFAAASGGSGGGTTYLLPSSYGVGVQGNSAGLIGYGNNGGPGTANGGYPSGGGGGAGGAGITPVDGIYPSTGGIGIQNNFSTGSNVYYGGGGGGGTWVGMSGGISGAAQGGLGGGGRGGTNSGGGAVSTAGAPNTGGGGGGSGSVSSPASAGGSGIVIIRYAVA